VRPGARARLRREAGVTAEPEVTFWHKLDTQDDVGWD
jgi:hypothetical protein